MFEELREILRTQYIGSILIALIAGNAVATLTTSFVRNIFWVINDQRTRSVLGSSHPPFPWDNLIYSASTVLLYLLIAYSLARWLYPAAATATAEGEGTDSGAGLTP
jgi:H+/Cl- antiporter ClcA